MCMVCVWWSASPSGGRELFKSEINDNYLSENARINNLQEVTLKLYLKDTPGLITTLLGSSASFMWLSVHLPARTLGACAAPLKIKSSLIMQIIHLLYFQHNTSYKRHNLLPSSLCQRRIEEWCSGLATVSNWKQLWKALQGLIVYCRGYTYITAQGAGTGEGGWLGRHVSPGGVCLA